MATGEEEKRGELSIVFMLYLLLFSYPQLDVVDTDPWFVLIAIRDLFFRPVSYADLYKVS